MSIEQKNVRLVKVDTKNFDALIDLEVNEEQKNYVANNIYSLAEAYATKAEGRFALPLGIYDGETPVGFLMVGYDYPDFCDGEVPEYQKNSYLIWRFMIDKNYQRKGYGRAAMQQALELVRSFPCGESEYCWISYEPENEAARNLYLSFGFEEKPEDYVEGEEMPAVMKL